MQHKTVTAHKQEQARESSQTRAHLLLPDGHRIESWSHPSFPLVLAWATPQPQNPHAIGFYTYPGKQLRIPSSRTHCDVWSDRSPQLFFPLSSVQRRSGGPVDGGVSTVVQGTTICTSNEQRVVYRSAILSVRLESFQPKLQEPLQKKQADLAGSKSAATLKPSCL